MAQSKKPPEELELAAHNRLKGTICFHTASAISQLHVINEQLNKYLIGCADIEERQQVNKVLLALYPITSAAERFKTYLYSKLDIGNSPSSYRNRSPQSKKQQYPHVSNQ